MPLLRTQRNPVLSPRLKLGIDNTYNEIYRAAMFMVEDATTDPTGLIDKEVTMWKDLSPVAFECLQYHVNLVSLME
jgi:hypothetical protein